jgi:hypothetical protein
MNRMHQAAAATAVVWLLCLFGCGGKSNNSTLTRVAIDSRGGLLETKDGRAKVEVPAGTVATHTVFSVQPLSAPPADPNLVPGTTWTISASGASLSQPVRITLKYDPSRLPAGTRESDLELVTVAGGAWTSVPGSTVDEANDTVSASVTHLSDWGARVRQRRGNWIWFRANNGVLYRIHPDGTGLEEPPKPARGRFMTVSPDGSKMISLVNAGEVYECGPDGAVIRQLPLSNMGSLFVYSPDGSKILCNPYPTSTGGRLAVANADGTNLVEIVPEDLIGTPGGRGIWMSPNRVLYRYFESKRRNGDYIEAYLHYRSINADGTGMQTLIPDPYAEFVSIQAVSTGGQMIGFAAEEFGQNYVHWLALIVPGGPASIEKIRYFGLPGFSTKVAWSPLGDEIAYCFQGKVYRSQASGAATPIVVYDPPTGDATSVDFWTQ